MVIVRAIVIVVLVIIAVIIVMVIVVVVLVVGVVIGVVVVVVVAIVVFALQPIFIMAPKKWTLDERLDPDIRAVARGVRRQILDRWHRIVVLAFVRPANGPCSGPPPTTTLTWTIYEVRLIL